MPSDLGADPPVPDLGLAGVVVLVFGAGSSGAGVSNGEAAAVTYARAGAHVACVDRDRAAAERVAKVIDAEGGVAVPLVADVTVEDQVAAVVSEAVKRLGPPGVLHNNVGAAVVGDVLSLEREDWERALAINVTGAFLTTRHVLPHLLARSKGAIVNVSSVAGIRDTGYAYPAYSASKAALNQLTTSLALTYADRGVRANAVLPGLIDTPMVASQIVQDPDELAAQRAARHAQSPTGRMGTPWDVAQASLFLASDLASYVNGVLLPVDGGLASRCL